LNLQNQGKKCLNLDEKLNQSNIISSVN